jgi:hypothetical protein
MNTTIIFCNIGFNPNRFNLFGIKNILITIAINVKRYVMINEFIIGNAITI